MKKLLLALCLAPSLAFGQALGPPGGSSSGTIVGGSCSANQYVNSISTTGVPSCAQPAISGISGLGAGVATLLSGASSGTGGPAGTTSPTFTTPALGAATGTSLALGGATIGTNALAVTGTANISGALTLPNGTNASPSIRFGDADSGFGYNTTLGNAGAVVVGSNSEAIIAILNGNVGSTNPGISMNSAYAYAFSAGTNPATTAPDLFLYRDAANILARRNGTTAQADRIYNSFTDASNGEWFAIDWKTSANIATVGPAANGTGTVRAVTATGAWTFGSPIITTAFTATGLVTNASLANMANSTVKCRTTAGTGAPEDCTPTQTAAIIGSVGGALKSFSGTVSRDTSLATGTQAVTGVGFQPTSCRFFAFVNGAFAASFGNSDSARNSHSASAIADAAGIWTNGGTDAIHYTNAAATATYSGTVQSYDADGLTFAWVKGGIPTDILIINYDCLR